MEVGVELPCAAPAIPPLDVVGVLPQIQAFPLDDHDCVQQPEVALEDALLGSLQVAADAGFIPSFGQLLNRATDSGRSSSEGHSSSARGIDLL